MQLKHRVSIPMTITTSTSKLKMDCAAKKVARRLDETVAAEQVRDEALKIFSVLISTDSSKPKMTSCTRSELIPAFVNGLTYGFGKIRGLNNGNDERHRYQA